MATQFDPIAKDESLNTTESPSRNVADVLAQGLDAIEQAIAGGSGSGGHTIVNASGTDMTQRAKMQFVDAEVTDDAVNDVTKISTTPASYPSANVTYGSGSVEDALDGLNRGSVSITADGTETYNTLLNSFFALIDESKLSPTSYLIFQNQIYRVVDISLGYRHIFIRTYFGLHDGKSQNWQIELRPSLSALVQQNGDGNVIDYSSYPPNVGDTFTLYY